MAKSNLVTSLIGKYAAPRWGLTHLFKGAQYVGKIEAAHVDTEGVRVLMVDWNGNVTSLYATHLRIFPTVEECDDYVYNLTDLMDMHKEILDGLGNRVLTPEDRVEVNLALIELETKLNLL